MKNILRAMYKDNCYIFVSCNWKSDKERFDEYNLSTVTSFVYDNGDKAAEWCPTHYGPISIYTRAQGKAENTKEHYIYDYILNEWGNWSQTAVSENNLAEAFVRGDYDYIFQVLKEWAG